MGRKKPTYTIATLDFETDPFVFGRIPKPFAVEFYSELDVFTAWGDDCVEKLMEYIDGLETEHIIFAHNGGKFDMHFLHDYIDNPIKIINARIVECYINGGNGVRHVMRDSFAIIPIPLKAFLKGDIDYKKMERAFRNKHKREILEYLHIDCTSLYTLVAAFVEQFGYKMTVGSTAMGEIKKLHTFNTMAIAGDEVFRQFYYGGRVQCFKAGILEGPWKGYDMNSAYPKVMRDYKHPVNCGFDVGDELPDTDAPYFLHFTGRNYGALPTRDSEAMGGLTFEVEKGEFYACSHEIKIAQKYGLIEIDDIIACYTAEETIEFKEFVDYWYARKVTAKREGDKVGELFAKFMLNSGYGKFGQNPENFADWLLHRDYGMEDELYKQGYEEVSEFPSFELWKRPAKITDTAFYDVSIAASITSGTRSMLLEGIQQAIEPVYCDTDSLICREFRGDISDTVLGAWKLEWEAPTVAIAGKKIVAAYDDETGVTSKLVSKGGTLSLEDLKAICRGGNVTIARDAPTFSLVRPTRFVERKFKMTAKGG